jgi:predicted Zn-dependent peptidase
MTLVGERPAPADPRPWQFPAFTREGRLVTCHVPGRPLAVASLVVDAGAATEPAGREGVTRLLAEALTHGTTRRNAFDFAVAAERLGADIGVDVEWDSLRAHADAPAAALPAAVELLAEALRSPALSPATLERVRSERLDELAIEASQPASRAGAEFARQVFAPGSRYSHPGGGDVAGVAAATDDDIAGLHAARLRPELATLVVVGDLDLVDAAALARTVFDGWSPGDAAALPVDVTPRDGGRRIVVVDRPGSVQSVLLCGHDAPGRDIPDYVATTTMALVLGGMFSSRLNLRLREDKGYTYGAFGGFDLRRHAGTFVARSAVQTEVTAPALADMVHEIETIARDGVTAAERDDAVAYRAGVFPVNFAGVHSVAHAIGDAVVHDWPADHFDRLRADVLAVTPDDLSAAAASRLRPGELVMVVVGDAAAVVEPLQATGLGPVEVVADPE